MARLRAVVGQLQVSLVIITGILLCAFMRTDNLPARILFVIVWVWFIGLHLMPTYGAEWPEGTVRKRPGLYIGDTAEHWPECITTDEVNCVSPDGQYKYIPGRGILTLDAPTVTPTPYVPPPTPEKGGRPPLIECWQPDSFHYWHGGESPMAVAGETGIWCCFTWVANRWDSRWNFLQCLK